MAVAPQSHSATVCYFCFSALHLSDYCKCIIGICDDFLLPWQHSLKHYCSSIQIFGAPNGFCSSIMESKHIKAVKEPWQCSNRNEPLGQMLPISQQLDKLAAAHAICQAQGMLCSVQGSPLTGKQPIPALPALWSDNIDADLDAEDDDRVTSAGDVWFSKRSGKYISNIKLHGPALILLTHSLRVSKDTPWLLNLHWSPSACWTCLTFSLWPKASRFRCLWHGYWPGFMPTDPSIALNWGLSLSSSSLPCS